MNRLWVRLTLAFVAVTLITILVASVLAGLGVDVEFRRYLAEQSGLPETTTPATLEPREMGSSAGRGMGQMRGAMNGMMSAAGTNFLNRLYSLLAVTALVAGGIGAVTGLIISRTMAAPLAQLAKTAQGFTAHDWERRAPTQGAREIADVARAFNTLADEIQRAETLRRNLMADIAHELRTPLTVMQGNLRALLDGVYPLELREIATLYDETRLLSRLVADLRELALAEAGQLPLRLQAVEIVPAIQQAVEPFIVAAEAQETTIVTDLPALPPVQADPDRLAQVMNNLLGNALRHTAGGRITVSGERQANFVRITVSDTGDGIPAAELPFIFERFYRGDDSRSGSTGLGLAIAKAWVEALGGQIGVDSATGQGSRFWFTVKVAGVTLKP
ncbi:MAG TPA: HAMP domain-containing sensor histidine kinase [Phototrophicaceae bacterium]|nr:HAMP domain-containing sensor histidine kinase [Phototrophicaceae bacterium]